MNINAEIARHLLGWTEVPTEDGHCLYQTPAGNLADAPNFLALTKDYQLLLDTLKSRRVVIDIKVIEPESPYRQGAIGRMFQARLIRDSEIFTSVQDNERLAVCIAALAMIDPDPGPSKPTTPLEVFDRLVGALPRGTPSLEEIVLAQRQEFAEAMEARETEIAHILEESAQSPRD